MDQRGMVILSGNSHPDLAEEVSKHLDIRLGQSNSYHKTNRETVVEIAESVRGKEVYIIQTGTKDVNNSIMELLIMAYACKTSSCNNVIGVIPYLPYSQQSKSSGDACATKLVASLHRIDNTFRMSAPGFHVKDGCFGRTVTCVDTGTFLHFPTSSIAILFCRDCNNIVMEMLIMAYACKTSTARRVIGVIPYMPYSQQSKMRRRGNISLKLLAQMLVKAGFNHIITIDLHSKESQGFFDCSVDNLRASPFLIQYIQESIPDYRNAVIVAKNPLAARRATSYAERLRLSIAVIHGEAKDEEQDELDGRASPPPPSVSRMTTVGVSTLPPLAPKEKPPINVVGDVGGKIAIMVDDIIDDVQSFVQASLLLKERGAYKIYVLATHGILSAEAPRLIEESPIDEVVVTNTVPHDLQKLQCHKIKTVDISILISEAIRRIHNKESMSHLFRHITLED